MSPEKPPQISEQDRMRARDVAERVLNGDDYYKAVRQMLANKSITHEPDVQRIIKELAGEVNRQQDLILDEQETLSNITKQDEQGATDRQAQEFKDVEDERGGDPED